MPLQLSGKLITPLGSPAANALIRFTAASSTGNANGEVIQGAAQVARCAADGSYSLELEYGYYELSTRISTPDYVVHGKVNVDADTTATDIEDLITMIGIEPVLTDSLIAQFVKLKGEAEAAAASASQDAAQVATDAAQVATQSQQVSTDAAQVAADRVAVENAQSDVAAKASQVSTDAAQVSTDAATVAVNTQATVQAVADAKSWAVGPSGSGTGSDTNNAKYWAQQAEEKANQIFVNGGPFTPAAGNEYPDVSAVTKDTAYPVNLPHDSSYVFTGGQLAGKTALPGDMMMYDTPQNSWSLIESGTQGALTEASADSLYRRIDTDVNSDDVSYGALSVKDELDDAQRISSAISENSGISKSAYLEVGSVSGVLIFTDKLSGVVYKSSSEITGTISSISNAGGYVILSMSDGSSRILFKYGKRLITVDDFGATPGQDSTYAFQAMADELGVVRVPFTVIPYQLKSIKTTRETAFVAIDGFANIKMIAPDTPFLVCVWLSEPGSSISHGFEFDQNNTSRSAIRIDADFVKIPYVTGKNFSANDGAPSTVSLIEFMSGNDVMFNAYATDMQNTGHSNESVPRIVSIQDNAGSYTSDYIGGRNVNVGLLAYAGDGTVGVVDAIGAHENGVYHRKGKLSIGQINYEGTNEPYVSRALTEEDTFTCALINVYGKASCVVNSDNSLGQITIGMIVGLKGSDGSYPRKLWRTRTGQVASGRCTINGVKGRFTGINLIETGDGNGSCEHLEIKGVDIDWIYNSVESPVPTRWAYIQQLKSYAFEDWTVRIIDSTQNPDDQLTASTFFQMLLPSSVERDSSYKNVNVYCYKNDGKTYAPFSFRANGLARERVDWDGVRWSSSGPYGREATYNDGVKNSINTTPSNGFWKAGTKLVRVPPLITGGVGARKIQYEFLRQVTGSGSEVTESGIKSGEVAVLSDWRVATHITGT